jgi:hypothetical protein
MKLVWLAKLLGQVLAMVTPEIKASLHAWVETERAKAAKTDNPWDDILFGFLDAMLS